MEKQHAIKYVVKVILITKPFQKIHFTVRHPENALCLTGIAVLPNYSIAGVKVASSMYSKYDTTGILSLAIPNKGDVFYTEEVKTDTGDYRDIVERSIIPINNGKRFELKGKRFGYFDTEMPIHDALMEGYYEDLSMTSAGLVSAIAAIASVASNTSTPSTPVGYPLPNPINSIRTNYKVTLYLRYEMNNQNNLENPISC